MLYKLMVVDDESETARALCNYFPWATLGFKVVSRLQNGKQAFEYILNKPVDVILCDIKMPIMTGIDLAREIFKRKLKIKMVFLSAYKEFEYAQEAMSYGVRNYILKPTNYDELVRVFTNLKKELDNEDFDSDEDIQNTVINGISTKDLSYNEKIIAIIKEYINLHYSDATLEKVALQVHMNPNYLSQFFKKKTGQNFSDYLISVKMQKAAEFLKDIQYKIYEISSMVGYSNTQNFARTFRNYFGVSPREYRNLNGDKT
ncbi:MAG: response regulator [Bacteroidales bacterium]|nr:response regulator [Bacteroidales bacterium]